MRLHSNAANRFPLSAEIDWCRQHPQVPEAARLLAVYEARRAARDGEGGAPGADDAQSGAELAEVTAALRKVRPRPMALVDRFYAYVAWNPANRSEAFLAYPQGPLLAPLVGCDLEHMRDMRDQADDLRRHHPSLTLTLWRYDLDRVIEPTKVAHLRSRNLQTRQAIEMFAWVAVHPTTGDETVAGCEMPWEATGMKITSGTPVPPGTTVFVPLVHGDAEIILAWKPITDRLLRNGNAMELRRFQRVEQVDERTI